MQPPTSWGSTTVSRPLPLKSYRRLAPFASIQFMASRVRRNLPVEHREDVLPVTRRAARVEDVAIGERVAVLGALVDRVAIIDRAGAQEIVELLHHRERRVGIHLGEAAVEL